MKRLMNCGYDAVMSGDPELQRITAGALREARWTFGLIFLGFISLALASVILLEIGGK